MKANNWGDAFGLRVAGHCGFVQHFANPKVSPNLRSVAQTAEGQLVQDLETGLIHLVV